MALKPSNSSNLEQLALNGLIRGERGLQAMLLTWQEEQQELSEVFKVRIGLASLDRDQFDRLADEIDSAMSDGGQRRDDAIERNRIDNFAARNFQSGSPPVQFTKDRLRRSLLAKTTVAERRASRLRSLVENNLLTQWIERNILRDDNFFMFPPTIDGVDLCFLLSVRAASVRPCVWPSTSLNLLNELIYFNETGHC